MELFEEMRRMLQDQNEKIESMYRENQDLREKISFLTADVSRLGGYLQQSPVPRMLSDNNCSVHLQLRFVNSCGNDKYSTRKIEADDKNLLNNKIITCEPFSSMRVRIVAIHGDFDDDHKGQWTQEYFHSKIVTGRPGKEHLLSGNLYFRLKDGEGYLNSAKFQDNSSFVPSKRFKLGVMAADERISGRIQEGITESFAVKDIRGFSTKKSGNPSPCDPVYKLSRIAMNGDRHKLLEQSGIKTVGDFLCFYSRSPEDLRKIMGKISDQDWDTIINHALKCNLRPGIYSTCNQARNVPHEDVPFCKGSCSVQRSPAIQKQIDVQAVHQHISSTYNGLASGALSENVLEEFEGFQFANQQVSSIGNEILPDSSMDNNTLEGSSSQQQCSWDHNTTPQGNGMLPGNRSANGTTLVHMPMLQKGFTEDESCGDFEFGETCPREGNMSHGEFSDASGVGSVSYGGISPAREVGTSSVPKDAPFYLDSLFGTVSGDGFFDMLQFYY